MTNDEDILAVLNQILAIQRKALSNQEKVMEEQILALQRHAGGVRLSRTILLALIPFVAYLVYVLTTMLQGRS